MTKPNSDAGQNPEPDTEKDPSKKDHSQKDHGGATSQGLPKGRSKAEHKGSPANKQAKRTANAEPGKQRAQKRDGLPRLRTDAERAQRAMQLGNRYLSRGHRWNQLSRRIDDPLEGSEYAADRGTGVNGQADEVAGAMVMPLFPLQNVVLFPGMVLPLHIFEPRYREMINRCIADESQFGVVLIEEGAEVGDSAVPHRVGTAAKITKVTKKEDGRMDIVALGTQRFEILELDGSRSYLQAKVKPLPIVNGATRVAMEQMQALRPRIIEYVELLSKAMRQNLPLDRLPEDPTTLALLVAIGMQTPAKDKQALLERAGVPEMLAFEAHLLSRETLLLAHMLDTQRDVQDMNMGPSGYIFPN